MILRPLNMSGWAWILILFIVSCHSDDPDPNTVVMPVVLRIPAQGDATRTPGDPGLYEKFDLPEHAYVWLVMTNNNDEVTVNYRYWSLDGNNWEKETYGGSLAASGDSVYRYKGDLSIPLPSNRKTGRFYVAVSKDAITPSRTTGCTSEAEVQGITFDATPAWNHLQDIYSTPYNYMVGGKYYGTISDFASNVPTANLLLYHVAAKVDIQWQVSEALQAAGYHIDNTNGITVTNLKKKDCLLFRPNENVGLGEGAVSDTHPIAINPGNQWIGRHSFYAIPYAAAATEDSPYTISMTVNRAGYKMETGDAPYYNTHTVSVPYYSTSEPFTQWMRADVNIKKTEED